MEHGSRKWHFRGNEDLNEAKAFSIGGTLSIVREGLNVNDERPLIQLGYGDPSGFPCFRTSVIAEDAVVDSVRSGTFNGYAPAIGLLQARRSVAEYLCRDIPQQLSADDVYLTVGARQAIEIILKVLACPGANILLPRPGYPMYEAHARLNHLEIRHFDLLQDKNWEVDLDGVEALADDRTVALVVISPCSPCGNVFTYEHLQKIAETARKLGILVIADESYGHLAFGSKPFVPMGFFGSIVPVVTMGSLSKRWSAPGWRLGWIAKFDPSGILQKHGIVECINSYLTINSDPATFTQGALDKILENTPEDFYSKNLSILRKDADMVYNLCKEIPCITCSNKPEGSMFIMVKLNLELLEDIKDDMDFCIKLAKEESVMILPGVAMGLKNWLRITFAVEPSYLEVGLQRLKAFCSRHAKKP